MSRDNLQSKGAIVELLGDSVCRVELPNGHRCIARASKDDSTSYQTGDTVLVAFHPYDLSRARLVAAPRPVS